MMWMREPLNVEVLPNACHLIQKSFYCKERPKLLVKGFLQHLKIKNISNRNGRFHSLFEITDLRNLGKLRGRYPWPCLAMIVFHLLSNLVLWAIKRTSLLLLFRLPLIAKRCTGGEVRNFQNFIFLYTKENVPYVFLLIFKITKSEKPLVYS